MAIWELAPGSPWNAILMVFVLVMAPCTSRSGFRQCENLARGFEVGRRVDAEGHGIDDYNVDPHSGLQRSQLIQPFLPIQWRGRQGDEAFQRRATIGIKPDVSVARSIALGRGGARKIECAQPPGTDHRADCLHDVW